MRDTQERIYLSPPHMSGREREYVREAFDSNWIAPLGPQVDAFEVEFSRYLGIENALALSSGTAALHLALIEAGVREGSEVLVSTLTFCASVNPILYLGGRPVFIDSERRSWNMDPDLLAKAIEDRARHGPPPAAVILVHLYGQCGHVSRIRELCASYGVPLIEDAAEALGATYGDGKAGTFGDSAIFSFNGNKIISTSGGGMLVSSDEDLIRHARKLAAQAREPTRHYEHREVGFNYRMSNVLAGIGRGQLAVLDERIRARRAVFRRYEEALGNLPGIEFMPDAGWGRHTRWLTCATIQPDAFGASRDDVLDVLENRNIEGRPVWKPMHLQPAYRAFEVVGGDVGTDLFERGICLPSGSSLSDGEFDRVVDGVQTCAGRRAR